jgi:TonB family protein
MLTLLCTAALGVSLPKLQDGTVPMDPVSGREGAFTILEVRVSPAGTIAGVTELGGLTAIADLMREHIAGWRFEPARNEGNEPIPSSVLVAVVNRAPALGGAIPPLPKTPRPAEASADIAFPKRIAMPLLPPQASVPGTVLLEVEVREDGSVHSAKAIRSSGGFDGVALDTIESWEFEPATRDGKSVAARAYALFSFRPPPRMR